MTSCNVVNSDPILYNDITVSIPDDEAMIYQAVRLNDIPMVRNQLKQNIDINVLHEASECMIKSLRLSRHIRLTRYTPLIVAVIHSQIETIEWLVNNGALVNLCEGSQRTPLHLAVATGRPDIVQYLISQGAKVNCLTKSSRTPLLEAVDVNSPVIVDMLITAGADVDQGDIKGTTPLLDAVFCIGRVLRDKQLNMKIVKRLISGGCDVNKKNNLQATALMMAVGSKTPDIVDVLLDAGANINHEDNKKRTAFHLLVEHDKMTRMALQLLHRGADMNTKDSSGKTPIEKAVKFGKFEMIKFLLHADCQYDMELINSERMKYLCEVAPVFGAWISHHFGTVKTLKRLCRSTIRNATQAEHLKNIPHLDLPVILKDYLMFKSM